MKTQTKQQKYLEQQSIRGKTLFRAWINEKDRAKVEAYIARLKA